MRAYNLLTLLFVGLLIMAWEPALCGEISSFATDSKIIPLIVPLTKRYGHGLYGTRYKMRITKVEIIRVIPKSRNNPLNPTDPIHNTTLPGGQVVYKAPDELQSSRRARTATGSSSSNLQPCVKNASMNVVVPAGGGAPAIYDGNFDIDPSSLSCRMPPPGVVGRGNFSITYSQGDPNNTQYCLGTNEWDFSTPGPAGCRNYNPGLPVSFVAKSNTGKLLRVVFMVDLSKSPPLLQILSLTPLN